MKKNVCFSGGQQKYTGASAFQIILFVVFLLFAIFCKFVGAPMLGPLLVLLLVFAAWKMRSIFILLAIAYKLFFFILS